MATIVTRAGKGTPLTNNELDSNFVNLDAYIDQRTNPLQLASRVAMTGAASGSNGIQVQNNPQVNFGTGDFTLHWEGALPSYTPAAFIRLFFKFEFPNGFGLRVNTNGTLVSSLPGATSTVATGLTDNSFAKITMSVIRETVSTAGSVTFYVNGVQLGSPVVIAAGAPGSTTVAFPLYMNGTNSERFASDTTNCIIYNRALSATEVLSLCINGVALADVGASQTAIYTSDFSAGVDGWIGSGATLTGNIDSIDGFNDTLRIVSNSTGVTSRATLTLGNAQLRKNNLLFLQVYRPAGNATVTGVNLRWTIGTGTAGWTVLHEAQIPADTWTTIQVSLPASTSTDQTAFTIYGADATGSVVGITAGDILYIASGGTLTQLGTTAQYNAQDAQSNTGQLFDSSGNGNHALLPAAGATVLPRRLNGEVRWVNTWVGTNELQYIGGVNQAILPANAYIESIIGTVSGATPHDIIIGDGSDTDRYVTITTGLAAGVTSFALASRVTDGTNLKLTVDPDTNATMSIAFTIKYSYLES